MASMASTSSRSAGCAPMMPHMVLALETTRLCTRCAQHHSIPVGFARAESVMPKSTRSNPLRISLVRQDVRARLALAVNQAERVERDGALRVREHQLDAEDAAPHLRPRVNENVRSDGRPGAQQQGVDDAGVRVRQRAVEPLAGDVDGAVGEEGEEGAAGVGERGVVHHEMHRHQRRVGVGGVEQHRKLWRETGDCAGHAERRGNLLHRRQQQRAMVKTHVAIRVPEGGLRSGVGTRRAVGPPR